MASKKRHFGVDLYPFPFLVLICAGVLAVLAFSSALVSVNSPDNVQVRSAVPFVSRAPQAAGGGAKQPSFIDVKRDRLEIYPGGTVVPIRDLERKGNALDQLLDRVEGKADSQYVMLGARPGTATVVNRLKDMIRARGVEVGCELYREQEPIDLDGVTRSAVPGAEE